MAWFTNWFSDRDKENMQLELIQQSQQRIRYDPNLVALLERDHAALFEAYTDLKDCYDNKNFSVIPGKLRILKEGLQAHLLLENVKLYAFLQERLADDEENLSFINELKREMASISRQVIRFIKTYSEKPPTAQSHLVFGNELETIGDILIKRVKFEEQRLYPLYQSF